MKYLILHVSVDHPGFGFGWFPLNKNVRPGDGKILADHEFVEVADWAQILKK